MSSCLESPTVETLADNFLNCPSNSVSKEELLAYLIAKVNQSTVGATSNNAALIAKVELIIQEITDSTVDLIAKMEEVAPSRAPQAITVSDVTTYTGMKGFRVGGAGDLTLTLEDDTDINIIGALAGEYFPINCKKFKAATTATVIIAYF